jgi:hypothetical protein
MIQNLNFYTRNYQQKHLNFFLHNSNGEKMDENRYILPGIIILVVVLIVVVALAFTGNNTFETGKLSFEYPNSWGQNSMVGNFSNNSLYSAVTLTSDISDANGVQHTAYIIIQMQQKAQGAINLSSTNSIMMNTTNSSVATVPVGNFTATQIGSYGPNLAEKTTIIEIKNYDFVIKFICAPYAYNQTSEAYNMILNTMKIT